MTALLFSFKRRNVQLRANQWLFKREWPMRFEWLALMAYKRLTAPEDQAWVTIEEISHLPSWHGKSRRDAITNVGRYLHSPELTRHHLVNAQMTWSGPYMLEVPPLALMFDIPLNEVRERLGVRGSVVSPITRAELIEFTRFFTRAHYLVQHGRLVFKGGKVTPESTAYSILMHMADGLSPTKRRPGCNTKTRYTPNLRCLALIAAMDVLFLLGRYQAARNTLLDYENRLKNVPDLSLRARFRLKLAWTFQRSASGKYSDRAVEAELQKSEFYARNSGDRATLGLLARRTGGYRTKKGFHVEAINQMCVALEAGLITGNYEDVQADCGNIGSVVHRLGPTHYDEACDWLQLSIGIAQMMDIGKEDAHAEAILAKIYTERNDPRRAREMLERAERIAERAHNTVNLGDVHMMWGIWHERFGKRKNQIDSLASALRTFRSMRNFDVRQKVRYMETTFPEIWGEVVDRAAKSPKPAPPILRVARRPLY